MKSDVYSFCMVLWHLLSRKLPFQGEEKKLSLIPDIALKGKVGCSVHCKVNGVYYTAVVTSIHHSSY